MSFGNDVVSRPITDKGGSVVSHVSVSVKTQKYKLRFTLVYRPHSNDKSDKCFMTLATVTILN